MRGRAGCGRRPQCRRCACSPRATIYAGAMRMSSSSGRWTPLSLRRGWRWGISTLCWWAAARGRLPACASASRPPRAWRAGRWFRWRASRRWMRRRGRAWCAGARGLVAVAGRCHARRGVSRRCTASRMPAVTRLFEREQVVKAADAAAAWAARPDAEELQLTGDGLVRYGKLFHEAGLMEHALDARPSGGRRARVSCRAAAAGGRPRGARRWRPGPRAAHLHASIGRRGKTSASAWGLPRAPSAQATGRGG